MHLHHVLDYMQYQGFTAASDRQRLDAFLLCGIRLKFYNHDDLTIANLVDDIDGTLLSAVLYNCDHVLHYIGQFATEVNTVLDRMVAIRRDSRNFFPRLLFKYVSK